MRRVTTIGSSLVLLLILTFTTSAFAQIGIGISVGFGPPALPVYEQPLCPGDGYIWTPGYWAWDNDGDDYYWVPGTWVLAPEVGYLWTPPWWGWEGSGFLFHEGYWGPQIGFYGGINYGFGYFGEGYAGGRWQDGRFFYNREVNNINVTNIRNVYNERVTVNNENHVSYNGHGGVEARPTPQQEAAMRERHIGPVSAQMQHLQVARGDRSLRASENHGKPPIAATPRPGSLREGAVAARAAGGNYEPPPNRGGNRGAENRPTGNRAAEVPRPPDAGGSRGGTTYGHARDLPPMDRPSAPNTGDAKRDRKYQQQQEKMMAQQNKEREKLQAQQEKDHQRMEKQQANDQRKQQMEQRHQQQTQQMSERHQAQQQKMQTRMAPSHPAAPPPPAREGGGKPK